MKRPKKYIALSYEIGNVRHLWKHFTYVINIGYIRFSALICVFVVCHERKTGWWIPLWRVACSHIVPFTVSDHRTMRTGSLIQVKFVDIRLCGLLDSLKLTLTWRSIDLFDVSVIGLQLYYFWERHMTMFISRDRIYTKRPVMSGYFFLLSLWSMEF